MNIAVLIPCYNDERFLPGCLESVLASGAAFVAALPGSSFSVLCCDDGSSDGTWNVLETYSAKHPNIRAFKHPNHGVSYTRNSLLDRLDGSVDAFAFVDADDEIGPEYLPRLAEAMERTRSDVAEYAADLLDRETLVEDTSVLWLKRTNPGVRSAIVGKLIRRASAGGVRLRSELRYEEDLMYSYEVNADIGRKVILPGFPYSYQYNPNSATQKLDWRRYVESACRRIGLFATEFLERGKVPARLVDEFRDELVKDAFRMCVRKNLKGNRDPELRRELFFAAADFFRGFVREHPSCLSARPSTFVPRLIIRLCIARRYLLSRALVFLT